MPQSQAFRIGEQVRIRVVVFVVEVPVLDRQLGGVAVTIACRT
jgi:hypothetical protein